MIVNKHEDAKADEVERLLPMIRRGSNAAFLRLSELYAPLLEREVARYAASLPPADLDDLRQSASVSLYRAALAFHGDRGVTFGLFAKICIVNGIADSLRYIRGKGTMLSMEDLDEREQPDGDEPNPQSLLLDKEQVWETRRQIKAMLSPLEYEIFEMYISGFSYAEIASRIGKSQKSVDNALCRIKKKLRQNLKQPT
ncbi:MAG: hypothetical protein DBX93_04080 [Oscillospiraceae bacterium]|nr:MAG: hypothetical protein DBX93_04080 [Oscillospiraceae bacterium]